MNELLSIDSYKILIEQLKDLDDLRKKTSNLSETLRVEQENHAKTSELLDTLQNLSRVFCRTCQTKTKHKTIDRKTRVITEDDYDNPLEYMITEQLECAGCSTVVNLEYKTNQNWDLVGEKKYNPEVQKWHLSPKPSFEKLEDINLKKTYYEAIKCYNQEMEIPCSMTIRTLIEGIGIVLGIKQELINNGIKPFDVKIDLMVDKMVKDGIMTAGNADVLKKMKFLGNEATHNMIRHPKEELQLGIQIVENIIENLFIIPKMFNQLASISNERRNKKENQDE